LEDCLALAREKNPVLGAARERVQELVADYEAARSKFFPKLTLISYYQRIDPERLSPGGGTTTQNLFGREGLTSLTGKQLVFDGLKTYYNTKAATFGKKAQQQEMARTAVMERLARLAIYCHKFIIKIIATCGRSIYE
jgi:outer membrane protein TolC